MWTDKCKAHALFSVRSGPKTCKSCIMELFDIKSYLSSLSYIHDHLINAICSQKLSCLCLLDLSAAFDTIDHNILITHLSSWFGIHGSVLNCFKYYLSSRSFCVRCDKCLSSSYSCLCGAPQGSVLGPLLFIMYTSPLSTLISSLSLNHHLYADDTQIFFSFYAPDFLSNITYLKMYQIQFRLDPAGGA